MSKKGGFEMSKTKSTKVKQLMDGIEILKKAHQSWPEGAAHPLIAEALKKAEADFKEEWYQEERKKDIPGEGTKRVKKE
jgi:hypothetical protein